MDDTNLTGYYFGCEYTKSARNHIALTGLPEQITKWAEPVSAYAENMARLFTSHQCSYLDVRDDCTDGTLLY